MRAAFRTLTFIGLLVIASFAAACGGGGSTAPTATTTPPSTTTSTPSTTTGPTAANWSALVAQLASMANDSLLTGLGQAESASRAFSGLSSVGLVGIPVLPWSTAYFCCDSVPHEHVDVDGKITVSVDATGSVTLEETISSAFQLNLFGPDASIYSLQLPTDGLRIVAELKTVDGQIQPTQTFHLIGPVTYWVQYGSPVGVQKTGMIDVFLGYGNFHLGSPTATGTVGTVQLTGAPLPPVIAPPRCSRPREGCPPCTTGGCGDAPCTLYPLCPK